MARGKTRATARRGLRPDVTHSYVPCNGVFLPSLIEHLRSLPSPDEGPPPAKRAKLDTHPIPWITVVRKQLHLSRRHVVATKQDLYFSRNDVGSYLRMLMSGVGPRPSSRAQDRSTPSLVIRSPKGVVPAWITEIEVPSADDTPELRTILSLDSTKARSNEQGAIWVVVDIDVACSHDGIELGLSFEVRWNVTLSPYAQLRTHLHRPTSQAVIDTFFSSGGDGVEDTFQSEPWSPMDFYDAAFVPPKDDLSPLSIYIPNLKATLYPFQKRTIQWLLHREGVRWSGISNDSPSSIVDCDAANPSELPLSFREVQDANNTTFYLSDVFHTVTTDITPFRDAERSIKGGILAEEMGLGKTLEIIGLVLLHPRPSTNPQSVPAPRGIRDSTATLIVTPESLKHQWLSELAKHAPHLRVTPYSGCKATTPEQELELVNQLLEADIVVTTYRVLSSELHFVFEPPARAMRQQRKFHRPRSPLIQINWWRICLDEAQMIESGVSHAAAVAKVIPRVNAWGVTGTPVKNSIQDLQGLLVFLRYEPYSSSTAVWDALTKTHRETFRKLFHQVSLRHTKAMVRDEIQLPPQNRYVITMPFTAVEEQHYQSMFKEMAEACNLDNQGAPIIDDWSEDAFEDKMRVWLNRLRQAALHPEVVMRRTLGSSKNRPMRTVDEVLDAMIEQSERAILADQRSYLSARLSRGQLLENGPRVKEALSIWESVENEVSQIVVECREQLERALEANRAQEATSGGGEADDDADDNKGGQINECRRRLRFALEVQHRAVFFCANAYFQIRENKDMTEPDSEEFNRLKRCEDEGYDRAKAIRKEILAESHRKASNLMSRLAERALTQSFAVLPELILGSERGLESRPTLDQVEDLYDALNEQANQLDEWREAVIQLLLKPLVDEDEEAEITGDEFSDSTKFQENLMVFVSILRASIADRQDAISGQTNELIKHETQVARANALADVGPAPQTLLALSKLRDEHKPSAELGSLRSAVSELRQLCSRLNRDSGHGAHRGRLEALIAEKHIQGIQKQATEQNKVAIALESELEAFTAAMNARLEYYRQLQSVSDSVLPYEGPKEDADMNRLQASETELRRKLASSQAKHRYLLNIKEAGSKSNEPRLCIICQTTFMSGVLTVCGHQFCKECMMLWFKSHRNCPVCKRHLKASNLHDIVIKPQGLRVRADDVSGNALGAQKTTPSTSSTSKRTKIYSEFGEDKLAAIKDIELQGPSFTTKVDTLIRHLLWLRQADPGAKSIVYSSYSYFLDILANAFSRFRIGYTSIGKPDGIKKFKEDPGIEVFILHARAHSSGLNLVNANHVFLCEPLLNTALELQAIARVDRIGQTHETTVWLYLIDGTVEEYIYNLSVQRRMDHMGRHLRGKSKASTPELLDASIDEANTLELEQAQLSKLMNKGGQGGEVVDKSDLWQCLFGNTGQQPATADHRLEDSAVMGYLARQAAEERRGGET